MEKLLAIVLCLVLILSMVGCGKDIPSDTNSKEENSLNNPKTDSVDANSSSRYIVDTSLLSFESSMETASGDLIDIYADSIHRYYVVRETNELHGLSLSGEMMESLEQKYSENQDALISTDAAEQRLREAVKQYFPEYDDSKLQLDFNDETGNPLEFYAYIVYEYDGMNRVNTQAAELTVDPAPDTLLRIFMAWKPLASAVDIPAQELSAAPRTGFTVVEWGGC